MVHVTGSSFPHDPAAEMGPSYLFLSTLFAHYSLVYVASQCFVFRVIFLCDKRLETTAGQDLFLFKEIKNENWL